MFLPVTKCVWSFVNIEQLFELTLTQRISIQTQMIDLPKYFLTLNEDNKQNMCVERVNAPPWPKERNEMLSHNHSVSITHL